MLRHFNHFHCRVARSAYCVHVACMHCLACFGHGNRCIFHPSRCTLTYQTPSIAGTKADCFPRDVVWDRGRRSLRQLKFGNRCQKTQGHVMGGSCRQCCQAVATPRTSSHLCLHCLRLGSCCPKIASMDSLETTCPNLLHFHWPKPLLEPSAAFASSAVSSVTVASSITCDAQHASFTCAHTHTYTT